MSRTLKIVVGVVFFLYMIVQIISFGIQDKTPLGVFEKSILFVASPLQNLANGTMNVFGDFYRYYVALGQVSAKNDALVKENQKLGSDLKKIQEIDAENRRLRQLLSMAETQQLRLAGVERVANGASSYQRSVRFKNLPEIQLRKGSPIIHPAGVVGQVIDVHSGFFDAILLTDKTSAVDVLCVRSRQRGILIGHNSATLRFEYLEKSADLQIGDEVITTGLDDVYPKGLPVGKVIYVNREGNKLFMEALVKPFVDFSSLEEAAVVVSDR